MKKIFIAFLLIVGTYLLYRSVYKPKATISVVAVPLAESRPYCFVYKQAATDDAPYAVEEHMSLTRVRGDITGTKEGTQMGPDMSNGYTGTLAGSAKEEGSFELVYSYTIEGSKNKELEIYNIQGESIVKKRYPLSEGKYNGINMLIPDQTKTSNSIVYTPEECK